MKHLRHPIPRHAVRPAFTLVELMISIALALMLIYGIAQVFKLSGDTIGAQQA
jgi:prepilin-type N-terminal cleavage/methylation domain-containing protein